MSYVIRITAVAVVAVIGIVAYLEGRDKHADFVQDSLDKLHDRIQERLSS